MLKISDEIRQAHSTRHLLKYWTIKSSGINSVLCYEGFEADAGVLKIDFICTKEYTNLEEA